jgi:hypothetical protein
MRLFRIIKYRRLLNARKKHYASVALSIVVAHAALGAVKYKSVGNGLADISLDLEEDLNFKLAVNDSVQKEQYELNGKWSLDKDSYVLTFNRPKIDLRQMFSGNAGFDSYTKIDDGKSVRFPRSRAGIMIDGIYCTRA